MKKKIVTLLIAGILALSVAACGGGYEDIKDNSSSSQSTEAAPEEPTDLTGTWKSEENEGSWMEATIADDTIEINWVSDDGNTRSIYWVGTYEAPTEAVKEYNWTSERDKEKTDTALLASTDDTKDFTYKDDVISYEVSAMGTTTTMELTKDE